MAYDTFGSPDSKHSFLSSTTSEVEFTPRSLSNSLIHNETNHDNEATTRPRIPRVTIQDDVHVLNDVNESAPVTEETPILSQAPRKRQPTGSFLHGSFLHSVTHGIFNSVSHAFSTSIRKLQKSLGCTQGFFLIVGILIGSGIFISPSLVAKATTNMGMALMIWIGCGLIALFGALCFCELGCAIQRAGGNYAYILEAYGPMPAFLCSWTTVLIIDPAGIAAVTLTFGTYIVKPFYDEGEMDWLAKVLAAVCILVVAFVNCWSVSASTRAQALFTFAQIVAVVFVVILGFWQMGKGNTQNIRLMFETDNSTATHFGMTEVGQLAIALYNGLWSYDGWALVSNVTEEMYNLERNLFLSVITGIPFVILCYVLVNLSFMTALTKNEIASSPTIAIQFVQKVLGKKVAYIMPVFVALSCYGAANGTVFACGRLTLAAAREGHMPQVFGMIHKKRLTPIPAILLASLIAGLMLIPDGSNLESLIGYFNFACWTIYGISIFAVVVLRVRQPHLPRPFKIWIIVPIIMTLISMFLVAIPFVNKPIESTVAIAVILSGIPVYFLLVYFEAKHCSCFKQFRKACNSGIQKAFNLAPCKF
eukprot:Seg5613.2 transcript_id=Seg5613.2/GoldUCD/mRNA.D3Y31 product="Glycoprotein-associated_amino acid transporter b0,+AT1" protein_id=Seg5613.2/GoldUCD/D3Y31